MKKNLVKVISFILTAVILATSLSCLASAADTKIKSEIPVIFVDGINSSDTINTETGDIVYPPSAKSIISGVSEAIAPLAEALIKDDYSNLAGPVNDALIKVFEGAACDENGTPVHPTTTTYKWQNQEEIDKLYSEEYGYTAVNNFYYSYDWRLDIKTLASQLHDYIEYILDSTGASQVRLIGFSMGTCVVMTYLHDFDYQYVDGVILLAGGFNGVSCCGESFAGKIKFSSASMVQFLSTVLGEDFGSLVLEAVINTLYQNGVMDNIFAIADKITAEIFDEVYAVGFQQTLARMAGFWSLIPYDVFDQAKEKLIGDNVSEEFIEKINYFHDEIQPNNEKIINEAMDRGINFAIIAKYGSMVPPCVDSLNEIGDSTIDTKFESFGATCALAGTTLGEDYTQAVNDGHNHISADNMIDASTCKYPEYTWFIKNLLHANQCEREFELCDFIFNSESQPTVWDNEEFTQFLIYSDGTLTPLTTENDHSKIGDATLGKNFFEKLFIIIKQIFKALKSLFVH